MIDVLAWWLVVTVGGAVSFPIAFVFLSRLPDRGYSFTKILGLLILGFLLFMGATVGLISNSRGAVILILLAMAGAGAVVASRRRQELTAFLSERWAYILLIEGLFVVSFVTAAWLRSFVPDLSGTEKPSEFAFLNAVLRSQNFPAYDPWLTPFSLSYYYFGFIIIGSLITLTAVPPEIGFNIAVALVAGLTVVAAFGVAYNLVAAISSVRRAVIFGFVGVLLVVLLANLEGVFEILAAHGIGPASLYTWVGIDGLNLTDASGTSEWYPDKSFFWWRSTRIPSNWDIKEYPFFSFLLGDLHPHFIVMPFSLLGMGMAFHFLRLDERLTGRWCLRNWGSFLLAAVALGSLAFLNAWSYPPVLALLLVVVFACNWRANQGAWMQALKDTGSFAVPMVLASVLLYLPFYVTARGSVWPLAPVQASERGFLPLYHMVTHPKHLFLSWGLFLWLGFGLGVAALSWRWLSKLGVRASLALLPAGIPIVLWAVVVIFDKGAGGLFDELDARGPALLTLLLLGGTITVLTLAFVRSLAGDAEGGESLLFALAIVGLGCLLVLGTELFFVHDHVVAKEGSRENTVFKVWHHSWLFFGTGGAFGLYYLLARLRVPTVHLSIEVPRLAWASVSLLLIAGSLVLPVIATFNRTNGFSGHQTLDGLAFLRNFESDEYEAVLWLRQNVPGSPVILEAADNPFTQGGRFSSRTGLPTIIEWPQHELGYRGQDSEEMLSERSRDVEMAFNATAVADAQAVLEKYDVKYVIVGNFERQKYSVDGLNKFRQFMDVAYQNESVTIYRVLEPGTELVTRP